VIKLDAGTDTTKAEVAGVSSDGSIASLTSKERVTSDSRADTAEVMTVMFR
jgi:hypothetical protein